MAERGPTQVSAMFVTVTRVTRSTMKTSALDKETPGLAALVEEVRQGEEDRLDRPRLLTHHLPIGRNIDVGR